MAAITTNNKYLFNQVYSLVPDKNYINFMALLENILDKTNRTLFYHVLSLIPKDYPFDWASLFSYAGKTKDINLYKRLIKIAPININDMVIRLIKYGDLEAVKLIINATNKNYPWEYKKFFHAARRYPEIINYLKTFIPKNLWPKKYR